MSQATFTLRGHNPDVLTCIANLSNDEVFTPPELANRMLDALAEAWAAGHGDASIWEDETITYLDPFTKSGVFLREIVKRLTAGLAVKIPDLGERVDHILTRQVFGIGITALTSLLARRSLYCSKLANGPHSVARSFTTATGNVWFERTEHTWIRGTARTTDDAASDIPSESTGRRCKYCGASEDEYERGPALESHAYAFIHADNITARIAELFGGRMQFDVVIGNPPYQLSDSGFGASAVPIYQKFVEQAKALEPRFLTMVIPARWYAGGRNLDEFRATMLADRRIRCLVDYIDSRPVFSGVDVAGGVCYFLWDRDHPGDCRVVSHATEPPTEAFRPLAEPGLDVFIRFNEAVAILRKVIGTETTSNELLLPRDKAFATTVSGQRPFGLRTFYRGTAEKVLDDDLVVLRSGGQAWGRRSDIQQGFDLIDKWKVFTSKSSAEHAGQVDRNGQRRVLSLSGVIPPGWVVSETYVVLGAFDTETEANNCYSYVRTRLFRYLITLRSSGQDISRASYSLIPVQDFTRPWTDQDLYDKYGLSQDEVALIERMIRPMDAADASGR
jgi:site-specific DNA-methyltransferase (adenine-specific)